MIYSSWDIEQNFRKLVTLGHFLPFYPHKTPQKPTFWKMKKIARDIIILQICNKNHNIWCTVPEIQSETERIFFHFGPFFALLPCPPTPIMILKMKILREKKKKLKMPGDIILLYILVYHKSRSYEIWFLK